METKRNTGTIWFILAAVFAAAFLGLCFFVGSGKTADWDWSVSLWVFDHRQAGLSTLMETITYAGNTASIIVIILLLLAFEKTRWGMGVPVFFAALFTTIVKTIVKNIVERPRPDEVYRLVTESGYSFPSGHAITSIAVYFLIGYLLWYYAKKNVESSPIPEPGKRTAVMILCFFLSVAIGLSRVYVGVHFLTDVFAGWTFGIATICLTLGIIARTDWPAPIMKRLAAGGDPE